MKTVPSYEVRIFIGGDLQTIEHACRRFVLTGLCVSVTPTNFIYTGCAESGAVIGIINYARFPVADTKVIDERAVELAKYLLTECCQRSCTVQTPLESHYLENEGLVVPTAGLMKAQLETLNAQHSTSNAEVTEKNRRESAASAD